MQNLHRIFKGLWGIALLASIIILPGCKRPTYTPRSFDALRPSQTLTGTQDNVTLTVSPLSKQEAKLLFDNRGDRLVSKRKPLHPVLITVKNESDKAYTFDPKTIELKLGNPHKVARRMYGHTSRRIIGPLVLGSLGATICFFGAAYLVILGTIQQVAMPALVKAGYSLLGISGLIAVGTPVISYHHGSHSYAVNKTIDQDVRAKTIIKPIEIAPGSSMSFLLFVEHRKCPCQWNIFLTGPEGNSLVFCLSNKKEAFHV